MDRRSLAVPTLNYCDYCCLILLLPTLLSGSFSDVPEEIANSLLKALAWAVWLTVTIDSSIAAFSLMGCRPKRSLPVAMREISNKFGMNLAYSVVPQSIVLIDFINRVGLVPATMFS